MNSKDIEIIFWNTIQKNKEKIFFWNIIQKIEF